MATPPTFVADYESAFDTSQPKTTSVTVQTGDVLVIIGMGSNWSNSDSDIVPSGGGLTYTQRQSNSLNSYSAHNIWTTVAGSNQTFNLSVAPVGSPDALYGFGYVHFRASDGIGASAKTTNANGLPQTAVTTSGANSALVWSNADWVPVGSGSRAYLSINSAAPTERTHINDGSLGAIYIASYADTGTAGSKTAGLSTPSGQKYSAFAVEVLGTSGGAVNVQLTPAVLTATAVATSPVPQPVSISLAPGVSTLRAVAVSPIPQPVSFALTPSVLGLRSVAVSPLPQTVSIALTPGQIAVTALSVSAIPGQVSIGLTPASLSLQGAPFVAIPGLVATALTPAGIALTAVVLNAGGGVISLEITPASLEFRSVALTPSPGPVAMDLAPGSLSLTAGILTAQAGQVSVALTPASLGLLAASVSVAGLHIISLIPAVLTLQAVATGLPLIEEPLPNAPIIDIDPSMSFVDLSPTPVTIDLGG